MSGTSRRAKCLAHCLPQQTRRLSGCQPNDGVRLLHDISFMAPFTGNAFTVDRTVPPELVWTGSPSNMTYACFTALPLGGRVTSFDRRLIVAFRLKVVMPYSPTNVHSPPPFFILHFSSESWLATKLRQQSSTRGAHVARRQKQHQYNGEAVTHINVRDLCVGRRGGWLMCLSGRNKILTSVVRI